MSEKLEPCPFCGNDEVVIKEHKFHGLTNTYGVECFDCRVQTYQFFDTKDEAVYAWNRRANNDGNHDTVWSVG